jgi:small redox-active disulfide protein 2
MEIKVLGPGCMNCKTLARRTEEAITRLQLDATITKVEDYPTIASFGIMSTPALVIDGKVVVHGRVPTLDAIKELLSNWKAGL